MSASILDYMHERHGHMTLTPIANNEWMCTLRVSHQGATIFTGCSTVPASAVAQAVDRANRWLVSLEDEG